MTKVLFAITMALGTMSATSRAAEILASVPNSGNWAGTSLTITPVPAILTDNPSGIYGTTNFSLELYLSDQIFLGIRPYGEIGVVYTDGKTSIGTSWLTGGQVVGSFDGIYNMRRFLQVGAFVNGASAGTNNFLGLWMQDTSAQSHYGWLQFELQPFSSGAVGARFIGGFINDAPNTPVVTGVVAIPEPTTLLLLGAGAAGLLVNGGRRRSSAR